MTDEQLTTVLAEQVMSWKLAPGRYIKADRSWSPTWRFAPLTRIENAFELLDATGADYTVRCTRGTAVMVDVRLPRGRGRAVSEQTARAITLAVAEAYGIEVGI